MVDKDYVNKIMNDESLYEELPDNVVLTLGFNNDCNCHCKNCCLGVYISRDKSKRMICLINGYMNTCCLCTKRLKF